MLLLINKEQFEMAFLEMYQGYNTGLTEYGEYIPLGGLKLAYVNIYKYFNSFDIWMVSNLNNFFTYLY